MCMTETVHENVLVESLVRGFPRSPRQLNALGESDAELLRMDSKEYEVGGKAFRVSVLETTSPATVLARKDALMSAMEGVAAEDGADQVLLFVIDILDEEATLLVPNDLVKSVAEKSFGATVSGDTVVLPGVMSRKKQIIPVLAA